jgi:hypothetical protein
MPRRLLMTGLVLGALGCAMLADGAAAAPPKNTIKLVCDRSVLSASATVYFQSGSIWPHASVSCGSDTIEGRSDTATIVATDAALVNVTELLVHTASADPSCPSDNLGLPLKVSCDATDGSGGATLIVR